jgi:hypothetical protein
VDPAAERQGVRSEGTMHMKTVFPFLLLVLVGCAAHDPNHDDCLGYLSIRFQRSLPDFTKDQIATIRALRPMIDPYLDNPNDYFISELREDSVVTVRIDRISDLRLYDLYDRKKQKNCSYVFNIDDSDRPIHFVFDKSLRLVRCANNWNRDCLPQTGVLK